MLIIRKVDILSANLSSDLQRIHEKNTLNRENKADTLKVFGCTVWIKSMIPFLQDLQTTCIRIIHYLHSFFMLTKPFVERKGHGYTHEHIYITFMQLARKHCVGLWKKTANICDWHFWVAKRLNCIQINHWICFKA